MFVVNHPISSTQIFVYFPSLIMAALGIDCLSFFYFLLSFCIAKIFYAFYLFAASQILTFALQVYVPTTYRTAADSAELGTMWLGYIPKDLVDDLAAQIKAKQSAFYTGVSNNVAQGLAARVNPGFNLLSVSDSTGVATTNNNPAGNAAGVTGASADSGKSRQDAIIGVVSALGAIALLVLVFLVYRGMKRRRQLAHHRLSDPPTDDQMAAAGMRPEGREFDQDSVGGARRRSFYFAEDSLRGYQSERQDDMQFDSRSGATQQMSQRRNVVPAAISAPILRESSMNW